MTRSFTALRSIGAAHSTQARRSSRARRAPLVAMATVAMMAIVGTLAWGAGVAAALPEGDFSCFPSGSLENVTTGTNDVACGVEALREVTTGSDNLATGKNSLQQDTTGSSNLATGINALIANTTGNDNLASSPEALENNTIGSDNLASGIQSLIANTTGNENIANGSRTLFSNTTGSDNNASGTDALFSNTTGNANIALGGEAGKELTTGSDNVDIANKGVAGESGTIRIGDKFKQTKVFVAGVQTSNVSGCSVQVTSEGQLGCNNNQAGSAVATYKSTKAVATGKCLKFTGDVTAGVAACPGATSGYSASTVLSLPMPANGATVSNLAASTSANVSGSDKAVVEVIDSTTSATLLTCTVNSTNKNNCTNGTGTGSAAALDKLEVRITATGASGNGQDWEVTFRY
jgi:hypothetical protein